MFVLVVLLLHGHVWGSIRVHLLWVRPCFSSSVLHVWLGKMEQILLAYGIPKETVAAITILYRNTKVKVRSPDGDTEYFDIVAGVLQGDTLAPYLFIIYLDYVLRTSIDKIREKKQKVPRKNNNRRRLRRWHSDTGKYTRPSRNTTA